MGFSIPDTVIRLKPRVGNCPLTVAVEPSATRCTGPTGTPKMSNLPSSFVTVIKEVSSMRIVTPGTGASWLSYTTPLMLVSAGSAGTKALALNPAIGAPATAVSMVAVI